MTCWVIYNYKNKLTGTMAIRFAGDTYPEISNDINEWANNRDDIQVVDVTQSIMDEDD
jgi:hypothetical protein